MNGRVPASHRPGWCHRGERHGPIEETIDSGSAGTQQNEGSACTELARSPCALALREHG